MADGGLVGTAGDRKFGYWAGHFIVVASMIGSGILATSGFTLKDTGNPAALLGLWVVGGVLALCGAVTVAELATTLPRSGGDYVFVREAYGRGAAVVCGWATFTLGFAAPAAANAHLAVTYLIAPFKGDLSESVAAWIIPAGATLLVLGSSMIHVLGHRPSAGFQIAATAVKAAVLIGLVVVGILFGRGDWNHLSAGGWPTSEQWPALYVGLIYVGYAYAGWNAAAYVAGEVRDPDRLLPRCLIGGTLTVVVLYLLVNLTYVYALDPADMKTTKDDVSKVAELATSAMFGSSAAAAVAIALGLSLVASVSAYMLTGPRVAFAMARDGVFPGFAGRLHPTFATPAWATVTQAAMAVGLIWSGTFQQLLNYTAVGLAALMGLTVASVFPLRHRHGLRHPFRTPLYPLPPLLFLALTGWTVGYAVTRFDNREQWVPAVLSLATVLVGIPLARLIPDPRKRAA